jgi:hypothetical protein
MIGDEAFAECERLEIEIPDSVTIIGENIIRGTKTERLQLEAKAEAERLEAERLEAERIERERIEAEEKEKREAEEKARLEAEKKARLEAEKIAAWERYLEYVGDPNDRRNPNCYGYSTREACLWLHHKAENASVVDAFRARIALAKGYYFGSWGEPNKRVALENLDLTRDLIRKWRYLIDSTTLSYIDFSARDNLEWDIKFNQV